MEYQDSITEKTMARILNTWEEELSDGNAQLEHETLEKIFNFLNDRETTCTADFVLRRQIQSVFPDLLKEVGGDFVDLSKSGNVPWEENAVDKLSRLVARKNFAGVSEIRIDHRQWKKF